MSVHTIEITEANHPLSEYVQDVETEPTVVTRAGKPIAVVVSIEPMFTSWEFSIRLNC